MKKGLLIFTVLLILHWSAGQDYRLLQADKEAVYISASRSGDSVLKVAVVNADWRLDYVWRIPPHSEKAASIAPPDSASYRTRHRTGHLISTAAYHHSTELPTQSFYTHISNGTSVNGILSQVNNEYRNVMQIGDRDFRLIDTFLPDTAAEYYVDGYKGNNSACLEVIYLWGAPLKDWSVGFSVSIHGTEARKVLSSMACMGADDTELQVRKIRIRQSNLLPIMSYKDMFCQ